MIDLIKILDDAQVESLQSLFNNSAYNPKDEFRSKVNIYQALMQYSYSLLESYHEALRQELAAHGIEI